MWLFDIVCLLWRNVLKSAHCFIGLFVFLIWSYMSCLYVLEMNPLSITSIANIFSHSVGCPVLFMFSFAMQKLLHLIRSYFFIFAFISITQASVQFSRLVMSDSLRLHEPQHARPPCPSPTARAYPNPCPSSRWCHPTISSSVVPFSSCPQSFPASGSLQMSQLFASGGQSIGVSSSTSVLPMNTQDQSPLGWTGWISL